MECGDLSPLWFSATWGRVFLDQELERLRQVAAGKSGDRSPHSKLLKYLFKEIPRVPLGEIL
jgi:hypothetical protein